MRRQADLPFFPVRLAPYERRVIELLRNSKDKRARKLAKKRVRHSLTSDLLFYDLAYVGERWLLANASDCSSGRLDERSERLTSCKVSLLSRGGLGSIRWGCLVVDGGGDVVSEI